jgi:SAM-dependent methyltransferase
MTSISRADEVRVAERDFTLRGAGRHAVHRAINVLFRRKTFERSMAVVSKLLREHGIAGKRVLELGCGSGEVSLMVARMGAHVVGLDVVGAMVAAARRQSRAVGLEAATEFYVADVTETPLRRVDVTLVVGVCEYYSDVRRFLEAACAATRELLIVVDTRGPGWRRVLRHLLAAVKGLRVHYRTPEELAAIVGRVGFTERRRVRGHSFWALAYGPVVPPP